MRKQVQVSLSSAEKSVIDNLAEADGLTRSAMVRKMIIKEAYAQGKKDMVAEIRQADAAQCQDGGSTD